MIAVQMLMANACLVFQIGCYGVTSANTSASFRATGPTINGSPASPSILFQPLSLTVTVGQTATFSVTASGTAPLSYQWVKDGSAVSGAIASSYATPPASMADNGARYAVVVSNSAGNTTSSVAVLTVNSATSQLIPSPSSLSFGNIATGNKSALIVTLSDSGGAVIDISNINISGPGFSVSGVPVGTLLNPGESASLNVTFAPVADGLASGSVTVSSDASDSPVVIGLSGTGMQPAVTSITVSPANPTIAVGAQLQFRAIDNMGNDITSSVAWNSSDSSKATITAAGLATGIADGNVMITATE